MTFNFQRKLSLLDQSRAALVAFGGMAAFLYGVICLVMWVRGQPLSVQIAYGAVISAWLWGTIMAMNNVSLVGAARLVALRIEGAIKLGPRLGYIYTIGIPSILGIVYPLALALRWLEKHSSPLYRIAYWLVEPAVITVGQEMFGEHGVDKDIRRRLAE